MTTRTRARWAVRRRMKRGGKPCFWCGGQTIPFYRRGSINPTDATIEHLISRWSPIRLQWQGLRVIACRECNEERAHREDAAPRSLSILSPPLDFGARKEPLILPADKALAERVRGPLQRLAQGTGRPS